MVFAFYKWFNPISRQRNRPRPIAKLSKHVVLSQCMTREINENNIGKLHIDLVHMSRLHNTRKNITKYHLLQHKVPLSNKYVIFQIGLKKWGLMNIYAPNHARYRTILWKRILSHLPNVDHWAIAGDFNMLEDVSDRLGGIAHILSGSELYEWEHLIFALGLMDLWQVSSFEKMQDSLAYSRSDK